MGGVPSYVGLSLLKEALGQVLSLWASLAGRSRQMTVWFQKVRMSANQKRAPSQSELGDGTKEVKFLASLDD